MAGGHSVSFVLLPTSAMPSADDFRVAWRDVNSGVAPPRRHAFAILFLCVWIGGWFFGERSAMQQLRAANDPSANWFLAFWLAGWTVGGAAAIFTVVWMTLGREVLELRSDVLLHCREIL